MKYGPLGRSGLMVSRICLGGNSWGAKGRRGCLIKQAPIDEVHAVAWSDTRDIFAKLNESIRLRH